MEEIVFYESWFPLDKKHFRILAMLADKGNFQGSLAQMCRNLSKVAGKVFFPSAHPNGRRHAWKQIRNSTGCWIF